MSDAYQAVYDATRSRMSNCDAAAAFDQAWFHAKAGARTGDRK
jgi:hypothetical protein